MKKGEKEGAGESGGWIGGRCVRGAVGAYNAAGKRAAARGISTKVLTERERGNRVLSETQPSNAAQNTSGVTSARAAKAHNEGESATPITHNGKKGGARALDLITKIEGRLPSAGALDGGAFCARARRAHVLVDVRTSVFHSRQRSLNTKLKVCQLRMISGGLGERGR